MYDPKPWIFHFFSFWGPHVKVWDCGRMTPLLEFWICRLANSFPVSKGVRHPLNPPSRKVPACERSVVVFREGAREDSIPWRTNFSHQKVFFLMGIFWWKMPGILPFPFKTDWLLKITSPPFRISPRYALKGINFTRNIYLTISIYYWTCLTRWRC